MKFPALNLLFLGLFLLVFKDPAFSQSNISTNEAYDVEVQDKGVLNGSIISFINDGYFLSTKIFDDTIVGVVNTNPDVHYRNNIRIDNLYPITSSGKAYVLVSNISGDIKAGDFITSSEIPGVGQKTTADGFIVGRSLENATFDSNGRGLVLAQISPQLHSESVKMTLSGLLKSSLGTFLNLLKFSENAALREPSKTLKYILAIIVVVLSVIFGFSVFGRVAVRGLEALGRNPLASKIITAGIVINSALTILITLSGLFLAYFIITL